MPFQTTANAPCAKSKVTVVFSGLMVLRPGPDNSCEIGIHRFSTSHQAQVLLMVNKPNKPPMVLPLLKGPLTDDFSIGLQNGDAPVPGDFIVFAPSAEPFDRFNGDNDERDYRWAVNFKDPELHPNVTINAGAQPMVKLTTGVLFTPHLTREGLGPRLLREDPPLEIPLNRIAASMAVAINPAAGAKVHLRWSDLGDPFERFLPRDIDEGEPDITYTVFVLNDPPGLTAVTHDEMDLYYKVLEDQNVNSLVNQENRFILDFEHIDNTRTDEIPCLTGRLDP